MSAKSVEFQINDKDAENLWGILSSALVSKLGKDPGLPFAAYELRVTLGSLRHEPDEELTLGSPERMSYCQEHDLTNEYFFKSMTWRVPRRLLVVLKLALKQTVQSTNVAGVEMLLKLCATLRLSGWFKKTFKKPVSVELEDDCELDDEMDDEDAKEDDLPETMPETATESAEAAD